MTAPKQFVIQEHTSPEGTHWDLMLEGDNTLGTWRLDLPPDRILQEPVPAEKIADHPLRFLTYEGPVQNQTGRVKIRDRGKIIFNLQSEDTVRFVLQGTLLQGVFELLQQEQNRWVLRRITNP